MANPTLLFDHEFALKQFSGNSELLKKMLGKFIEQYQSLGEKLTVFQQEQDEKSMKLQVHTVKGVSGNLGMKRLHLASREFEHQITKHTDVNALQEYLIVVKHTIDTIQLTIQETNTSQVSAPVAAPQATERKTALLEALSRNEFIPKVKLTTYLQDMDLNEDTNIALTTAIAEFDYDTAKKLLS